jgi:peroxiredoxin
MTPQSKNGSSGGILFDRVTNVALVLVILFAAVGIWRRPTAEGRSSVPDTYRIGETLPAISGFDYGQGTGTLVLFVHSKCHFCTETMPVYREVRETLINRKRSDVRFVAIARQPESDLVAYLKTHNLTTDHASAVNQSAWQKLAGTPTLFLVDNRGVVRQIWRGKQTSSAVATIVAAVDRLKS